jgi:hypothetical protein
MQHAPANLRARERSGGPVRARAAPLTVVRESAALPPHGFRWASRAGLAARPNGPDRPAGAVPRALGPRLDRRIGDSHPRPGLRVRSPALCPPKFLVVALGLCR